MTAVAPAVGRERPGGTAAGSVPWRWLTWVAWRQHRAALTVSVSLTGLIAIAIAVTGLVLHPAGHRVLNAAPDSPWQLYEATQTSLRLLLPLLPVLAGIFIGAPLVAREIETGAARFAWAQGAGRIRGFVATIVPMATLFAVLAFAVGLEFRWWVTPLMAPGWAWRRSIFGLNPLPFTGWMLLGFSLGVFLGAAIRRTVPAMAATLACYLAPMYKAATSWRLAYLPPLHRPAQGPLRAGGTDGYSVYWGSHSGPGPEILSTAFRWPDGRLLTGSELDHTAAWFRLHHIQVWFTYQPGSRFLLFEWIEFGWLVTLSALLIALTVVVIRRRAA